MTDHTMPDPDAVDVRIGCAQDAEAEATTKPADTDTFRGTCQTCGGSVDTPRHRHPSPHLWSGRTWAGDECQSQSKRDYCTDPCHGTGVK